MSSGSTVFFRAIAASAAVAVLAACSSSQVGKLPPVTQSDTSQFKLQLAVGTATIGHRPGSTGIAAPPTIGLNVVATFRQPNGASATLDNTPTLSGPSGFQTMRGLLPSELLAADAAYQQKSGASSPAYAAVTAATAFNTVIGVYGYGFAPLNLTPNAQNTDVYQLANILDPATEGCMDFGLAQSGGTVLTAPQGYWDGVRYRSLYLPELPCKDPVSDDGIGGVNSFFFYGGPPAWPSPQGYGMPPGFSGFPAGFMDMYVQPIAGTYSLDVAIPASADLSAYQHFTATAQLPASQVRAPLPPFPMPVIRPQSDGSAYIDVNVPSGVTEAIVFVTHPRCDGDTSLPSAQYSIVTHKTGAQTLFLSNNLGPPSTGSSQPTHTFCLVGERGYSGGGAMAVGFDYPAFEASYPQSTTSTPSITNGDGHSGTADLTSSAAVGAPDYGRTNAGRK